MIDLRKSRRTLFIKCYYWKRLENPDLVSDSELQYEAYPAGTFYAQVKEAQTDETLVVGQAFMLKRVTLTLYTTDEINLNENDRVEFRGEYYRVENVQKYPQNKQTQFGSHISYDTYIRLRK